MTTIVSPSPLRILVVENDAPQRDDLVKTLRKWGYETYVAEAPEGAEDSHQALLEDARWKARCYHCHLAIVDMRLRDDSRESDTSGLALVPELAPTVSIIRSGYGDRRTVREALKPENKVDVPLRAYDFVGKEDGPEALQQAVKDVEGEIWHRQIKAEEAQIWQQRSLALDYPPELAINKLAARLSLLGEVISESELTDMLFRLFPEANRLKIQEVNQAYQKRNSVPRGHSIVVKVTEDDHVRSCVVKLTHITEGFERERRGPDEVERFNKVRPYFDGNRYAALLGSPIVLWGLLGVAYEFLSGDKRYPIRSFVDYYATNQASDIGAVLRNFLEFWKPLYDKREIHNKSVFRAYDDAWANKLSKRLFEFKEQPVQYPDALTPLGLPNPLTWLSQWIDLGEDGRFNDGRLPYTQIAPCHGDLHGENLFADTRQDIWVIDYERTGAGPILQDFAEIETDIVTNLAHFTTEEDEWVWFLWLVCEILKPKELTLSLDESSSWSHEHAFKALNVIRDLRKMTKTLVAAGSSDERQYYCGLLFNAIYRWILHLRESEATRMLEDPPRTAKLRQDQRSLVSAGLICHRLAHWEDETWPPKEWKTILPSPIDVRLPNPALQPVHSDLELTVNLTDRSLVYNLNGGGRYTYQPVGRFPLNRSSEDILYDTFDRLSNLARKSPQKLSADEMGRYQEDLADIGYNLYDELFTEELKREYEGFMRDRPSRNLLIVSDDPWIPWEIVKPQLDGAGDPYLCESFHLARWLSGPAAPSELVLGKAMIVRPPDNLRAAQSEQAYLLNLPTSSSLIRDAVSATKMSEVLDSFRAGDVSLYHFACHGNLDRTDPNESRLKLEDGFLKASQIVADKRAGLRVASPIIFLNACHTGSLGYGLTRLGGWAQRFIKSGASAFIGTLWEVNDELAASFSIEFYNRLLGLDGHQPMPLAYAFHDARLVIKHKASGNPTWLAYVLYGNPNARVVQSVVR